MNTNKAETLIDLSEELIWVFVAKQIAEVKQVAARFKEGDFKTGLETALEEIEARLSKAAYEGAFAQTLQTAASEEKGYNGHAQNCDCPSCGAVKDCRK